jgi:hypothetical protein
MPREVLRMKAIVAEFAPMWSGWAWAEKAAAGRAAESSRLKTDSNGPKADLPQLSDGDHGTPPFWTWFIENPRGSNV